MPRLPANTSSGKGKHPLMPSSPNSTPPTPRYKPKSRNYRTPDERRAEIDDKIAYHYGQIDKLKEKRLRIRDSKVLDTTYANAIDALIEAGFTVDELLELAETRDEE